jgi:hypothetical protein
VPTAPSSAGSAKKGCGCLGCGLGLLLLALGGGGVGLIGLYYAVEQGIVDVPEQAARQMPRKPGRR